mmetsp:Transcript_4009/g.5388  ORF Transcript_4009/g.5388 Transcript_4009/m.5388 type:complete len:271 (-) Transcript_4009:63-875(-)
MQDPRETRNTRRQLRAYGWMVKVVDSPMLSESVVVWKSSGDDEGARVGPFAPQMASLHAFNLTEYSTVLLLSPNALVFSNVDKVFYSFSHDLTENRPISATGSYPSSWIDTGVMLIRPSHALSTGLIKTLAFLLHSRKVEGGDGKGPISFSEVVNGHFPLWSQWPHHAHHHQLPARYNALESMIGQNPLVLHRIDLLSRLETSGDASASELSSSEGSMALEIDIVQFDRSAAGGGEIEHAGFRKFYEAWHRARNAAAAKWKRNKQRRTRR